MMDGKGRNMEKINMVNILPPKRAMVAFFFAFFFIVGFWFDHVFITKCGMIQFDSVELVFAFVCLFVSLSALSLPLITPFRP